MGNGTKHGAGRKKHREHSAQRARHGGKSRKPTEQKKEQTSKARNRNNNNNSGNISPAKRQGNHHQDNNNASITSTSNNNTSATLTERVAEVLRAELPETHPALHIPSPVIAQKKTTPQVGRTPTPTSNTTVTNTTAAAQVELLRAVRASVLQAANATNTTTSLRSPTQGNEVSAATASRNSPVTLSRGVTPPHNNTTTTTSTSRNHNICTPAPVLGSSASFGSSINNVTRQGRHSPPLMNNTTVSSGSTRTRTVYKTQPPSLLASVQGAQQQSALPTQETNKHNDNRVVASTHEPTSRLSAPVALRAQVTAAEAAEDSASLNSSFSETAQSATRTGSCRSYILPARTNKATAEGSNTTMNSPALPDEEVVNNNEEDEDEDVDSVYDEEDEEQAVQQYMDSWVAPTRPRSSHSADTTHTQRNDSTEGSGNMKNASTGRAGSRAEAESDTDLQMLLRRRHPITTATLSPLERGTPSPQLTPPILPQPGLFASLVQPALPKTIPEVRNPTTTTSNSSSTTVTRSSGNHNNNSSGGVAHESATTPGSARRSLLELGEVAMITAETSPPVQPITTGTVHTRRAAMHEGTSYHSSRSPANSQVTLSGSAAPSTSVSQPQQQQSKPPAFISVASDVASRPGPHPNTETTTTNTTSTSTSKSGKSHSHSHGGSPSQHVAEFKQDGLCPVDTLSAIPPLPHLIGPTTSTTSATPAVGCIPPLPIELSAESCRQLSLYDCFVLDAQRQVWLVDDAVLAKCLEYIRLMAYEHPMLAHDKAAHRPSIWSSSASVPAPLRAVAAESGTPSACSTIDGVCRRAIRRSTAPVLCRAAVCNLDTLFLEQAEAMRWLVQQEYVIATLLACCARAKSHGASGRHGGATSSNTTAPFLHAAQAQAVGNEKREHSNRHAGHQPTHLSWKDNTNTITSSVAKSQPCVPAHMHPIHWVAQLVLRKFAQWGDFADFAQLWESQVRLVLCSAAPSHQRSFVASDDGLIFRSDFEGGNLLRVERAVEPYLYYLWLEPDCGSDKRIWFRFSIEGAREGRPLRFRLLNAAPHSKLYCENHMQPVWRDGARQPYWAPVDQCSFRTANNDLDGEVSFAIVPRSSSDTIQVAFCAPYTYADLLCHLCHWHNLLRSSVQSIRFEEKVLCRTPEGRKLHLLIISSYAEKSVHGGGGHHATNRANNNSNTNNNNTANSNNNSTSTGMSAVGHGKPRPSDVVHGPYANFQSGKKVILISGRVHPGEITASHGLHGLISFLLSSDPRAAQLREHFIFFIVPMLNPDGVSRGHSRMDQYGTNLNRCYNDPDPVTQPTVHALRRLFEYLQRVYRENFIMYLDFHSHASKSNAFMFGNCLPRAVQHWNLVFPKLVELHARDLFSFPLCRFTWSGMLSKDGASRVLFGAGLIHSYTIELPHFTDRRLFVDSLRSLNSGRPPCFNEPTGPGASAASSPLAALTIALNLPPTALVTGNVDSATSTTNVVTAGSTTTGKGNAKHHNSNTAVESAEGAAHGADGVPAADKITTITPARRATHNTQGSKAKPRVHRAASASVATQRADSTSRLSGRRGRRSVSSSQRPAVSTLREITEPCVLRQSALVGQACMLALLDYCSLNPRFSPELTSYGGMERVLTEVKRQIKKSRAPASGNAVSPTAAMQPIYRQY